VVRYSIARMRKRYSTDLSDAKWEYIEALVPTSRAAGRPRRHSLRQILEAIFYMVPSGCAWRLLLHEFPPWKSVHHYFRTWRINGTWEGMHAALCVSVCQYASRREILNPAQV